MFKKLLHEPLVHFLVLGALIFFLYNYLNGSQDSNNEITITQPQIEQMIYRWQKKHMRAPSDTELQEMIDKEVYTEILYREALKMGLDKEDYIVRRRMAQKMEFLSTDLSDITEPTEAELKNYLNAHEEMFQKPGKVSFQQIYINPNQEPQALKSRLDAIQDAIDANESIAQMGDAFMLPLENHDLEPSEVIRLFGKEFEHKLSTLPEHQYLGPIVSGYGLHFVYVKERQKGATAEFESVKTLVKQAWLNDKEAADKAAFYKALKKSYDIKIEK